MIAGYTVIDKTDTTLKVGMDFNKNCEEYIEYDGRRYKAGMLDLVPKDAPYCSVRLYHSEKP
jgi:hypothetical protein